MTLSAFQGMCFHCNNRGKTDKFPTRKSKIIGTKEKNNKIQGKYFIMTKLAIAQQTNGKRKRIRKKARGCKNEIG